MLVDKQRRSTLTGDYLKDFSIPDSRFHTFHKLSKNMADSKLMQVHGLVSLLHWIKTTGTWKTVIESMQSLGLDNFRAAYTRFLAFYSDNSSGQFVMEKRW